MQERKTILLVDDEQQMLLAMEAVLARLGHSVFKSSNGAEALEVLDKTSVDLIISDMRMPVITGEELLVKVKEKNVQVPMILITAYGTISQAVVAMKNGATDFITKPFSSEDLEYAVSRALRLDRKPQPQAAKETTAKPSREQSIAIVTNDPAFKQLLEIATVIAASSASVLIQGESGTGKELIARLIHAASPRRANPFVAVNCAALPGNLLESELFGHEKGAFTGAVTTKIGKFELAEQGTILLDEISEMEQVLQAKLLRVLQEREVDRVGSAKPIPIDVRVVATTNRTIIDSVKKGEFREDLYYRLNVVPLYVPPLRERKGDIKLLAEHFIRKFSNGKINHLSSDLIARLENHSWPGNVRELQNASERAVLLSGGGELKADHFLLGSMSAGTRVVSEGDDLRISSGMTVADAEKKLIQETLRVTENNKTKAAELLGISIRTLRNKLHEYALPDSGE